MIPLIILSIEDSNDREFIAALYLSYKNLMYSETYKIVKNHWETEDIVQTSLEKLIDKVSLLKTLDRNKRVNYIISTCRNTSYNFLRKQKKLADWEYHDFDGIAYDGNPLEDDYLLKLENKKIITAWTRLDERNRYLLSSKYILQKDSREIAQDLEITPNSVRMALTRARSKFKELIKELE